MDITMNELIRRVVAGECSADEAVKLAHPYALENFSCYAAGISDQPSIDAFCAIKKAAPALAPATRSAPTIDPRPILRCRKCGQTGHSGQYPFSTLAGSGCCDDCV